MTTDTLTLTDFLLARIAEDEAAAQAASLHGDTTWTQTDPLRKEGQVESVRSVVTYDDGSPNADQAAHIARHDPARVLAECEAKRRIVGTGEFATQPMKILAAVYADHADYRDEWR